MQGRPEQGSDPLSRLTEARLKAMKATGQHRAVKYENIGTGALEKLRTGQHQAIPPRRPPNMPRIETPPPTPRIAKPKQEQVSKETMRRRLLILSVIIVVCAIVGTIIGTIGFEDWQAANTSAGAASTATDFLGALNTQKYDQAYKDLGPAITLRMSPDVFTQTAQSNDHCFGIVKDYSEVNGSATTQSDGSVSFTYQVTRSKSAKTFPMKLTLQKDQDGVNWKIIDFGNNLGPSDPTCK